MRDLPFDLRFDLAGKRVRLVHGSPRKVNEYLLEDRAATTFERIAELADCDILSSGIRTSPGDREYGGVLFVNCAWWEAEGRRLAGASRCLMSKRRRTERLDRASTYDAEAVATEIREVALPLELADQLFRAA